MKIVQSLCLAAIITALTAPASAFPFYGKNYQMPQKGTASTTSKSSTIAVFKHGKGIGQSAKGASSDEAGHVHSSPHWR